MSVGTELEWDSSDIRAFRNAFTERVVARALRKAGATALRDAKSEASKRIRKRKRLKAAMVRKALHVSKPRGKPSLARDEWRIDVSGKRVPLSAYPHRQTKRGVSVTVNRGARSMVLSAFTATMRSGHKAIMLRRGDARLPIVEQFGSRPVDALLHQGEAEGVLDRARKSFSASLERLIPLEMEKARRRGR